MARSRITIPPSLGSSFLDEQTLDRSNGVASDSVANTPVNVPVFGSYSVSGNHYPFDSIQANVFNAADRYLESVNKVEQFTQQGQQLHIDVEEVLRSIGYESGLYATEFRFVRNFLGSAGGHKLRVQEVSSNGLEVRLVPILTQGEDNEGFAEFFARGLFQIPKKNVITNLQVFKDPSNSLRVFDYVQDKITFEEFPHSIILKLETPIDGLLVVGDSVWVAQEINDRLVDTITMVPPKLGGTVGQIGGPDWDVLTRTRTGVGTEYKDWDDLLTENVVTTQGIVERMFSGSLVEGIELNQDFRKFDNFVHFGSAEERVSNFKFKMGLLESYDARVSALTTDLVGLPSSSVTGSSAFQTNVTQVQAKREAILGGFDQYERYLYYGSASYETSSFGEFYPSTWPKSTSTKPYTNYSPTSSQAVEWFAGIKQSASYYDKNNPSALVQLIPAHVRNDEGNEQYELFVNMIGHYFDLIQTYIKQLHLTSDRNQALFEGMSKDLVFDVARSLGLELENGSSTQELWEYVLGADSTGSLSSTYETNSEQRTKEIWKRIVNNLPYLLKTRGTERSLRALINCFGIPQTILRVREYGGPEPTFESKTDYAFERFAYATRVGYNGETAGNVLQSVQTDFAAITSQRAPRTVELRVKMAPSQSKDQSIIQAPGWNVQAIQEGGQGKLQLSFTHSSGTPTTLKVSSSIYDGTPHHISIINHSNNADNSASALQISLGSRKVAYGKVVNSQVASGSWSNTSIADNGVMYIPASGTFAAATSHSMAVLSGSVQELRFWSEPLQSDILDNHTLAPTSFQGNLPGAHTGSTSSFDDLSMRLTLGGDAHKIDYQYTSSLFSQHPNQTQLTYNDPSYIRSGSFVNFGSSSMEPIVESYSLEWPDLGGNRSVSNKIRIEEVSVAGGSQLYTNNSVQRSSSDNNPPDSPRLGVYLSPTNEVDQDIAQQFGGLSIDDFIGDPTYYELNHYPGLDELRREYYKKYNTRNNGQNYIRLLRHYDASLFQLIKKFVPYRANTQVGLVIEPTILDRAKLPSVVPSWEDLQLTGSLDTRPADPIDGYVSDGDGEPFRDMEGYVQAGTIQPSRSLSSFVQDGEAQPDRYGWGYVQGGVISGSNVQPAGEQFSLLEGSLQRLGSTVSGSSDQSLRELTMFSGSEQISHYRAGGLEDIIDIGISSYGRDTRVNGSQYQFDTFNTSGSGDSRSEPYLVSSTRYDYHNPRGLVIQSSRRSERSNFTGRTYDGDMFGGLAFSGLVSREEDGSYLILYDNNNLLTDAWTSQYGLRLIDLDQAIVGAKPKWGMANHTFPGLYAYLDGPPADINTEATLDAFHYNQDDPFTHNLLYQVDVTLGRTAGGNPNNGSTAEVKFGSVSSSLSSTVDINLDSSAENWSANTYITKADGHQLSFYFHMDTDPSSVWIVTSVKVRCLNYRAGVQDFHLHDSKGMVNARYDGCKMSSADWGVDSPDTIDGGPVVTITVGGDVDLVTNPTSRGTFIARGSDQGRATSTGRNLTLSTDS